MLPRDYSKRVEKFKATRYSKDLTSWKTNISNSIKGRIWINDGVNEKQIIKDELQIYILKLVGKEEDYLQKVN